MPECLLRCVIAVIARSLFSFFRSFCVGSPQGARRFLATMQCTQSGNKKSAESPSFRPFRPPQRSFEADTGLKPAIEKVSNYLSLPSPKGKKPAWGRKHGLQRVLVVAGFVTSPSTSCSWLVAEPEGQETENAPGFRDVSLQGILD